MKVSVIIPAYEPLYLKDALESAYRQSYTNYEIIVIDDCSKRIDIEKQIKNSEVTLLRMKENSGPAAARNFGVKHSSGDLISFLDADDIWAPHKLSFSVRKFEDKDVGLTCGNYRIFLNRRRLKTSFYKNPITIDFKKLLNINYIASGSVTISRKAFDECGPFDEKLWLAEDYKLWLSIAAKYKIEYIHDILYFYSICKNGNSLTQRRELQMRHLEIINKIKEDAIENAKNFNKDLLL